MQNQKITIEVIESKEFHVASRGYNQHEVDEFLDSICDELERVENEITALKQENERLRNQAVPAETQAVAPVKPVEQAACAKTGGAECTFREILEMAQRVKEETIADAEAKAAEIVKNAENEARARLGNLAEDKENLEKQIETLKGTAKEYKEKFAALLSIAHDALDAAEEL